MNGRWLFGVAGCASALVIMSGAAIAQGIPLDGIVVTSTKTSEAAIDALSGTSVLDKTQLDQQFQADRPATFLMTLPGVTTSETARDTATAINLRGLQDFGRVNVLIDGARQNFQRTGHNADGAFYIDPEMIKRVDITRGPSATIYGSGAIGGVAAFDLIDADDILKPGEMSAVRTRTRYSSNGDGRLASGTGAVKVGNFDVVGQLNGRWSNEYEDGSGKEVANSGDTTKSGMAKARWRPALGHQFTGTIIDYNSEFVDTTATGGSPRATEVNNQQYSLGYTFSRPDTPLVDFSAKVYRNDTEVEQRRKTAVFIPPGTPGFPPGGVNIPIGATRTFNVETMGTDVHNTSRFNYGAVKLALTYGGDVFRDQVTNIDPFEGGDVFTPSGERTVGGAFVQSRLTFFDKIDLITALRYDTYNLSGIVVTSGGTQDLETDGDRVSPKITLGVTPVKGITVFGTYAEGYRAPAVTESFVSGFHPAPGPPFEFLPNPFLRPEVAHNFEVGVNFKYNSIVTTGDAFRARVVAFRNKVDDFIDPTLDPTYQSPGSPFPNGAFRYLNISQATLEGIELEAMYDAKSWFAGVAAHRIRGTNEDTGEGLYSVPADRVVLTAGFRTLEQRLTTGGRVHFVAAQNRLPSVFFGAAAIEPSEAYTLVDLFAQYEINPNATLNLNIDNLFDKNYRQYLDQDNSPGLNARIGLTVRFGGAPGATP
jgi:hemoglobin/transferrin/lactoferrin receptor protein